MRDEHRLVLDVGSIPDNANVTKLTGTKHYKLRKSIRIGDKLIPCDGGAAFLVDPLSGNASVADGDTSVIWHLTTDELYAYLIDASVEDK